jgi:cyclic-di-GMP phosphodiesterase TipF (flagellum assembly factor)
VSGFKNLAATLAYGAVSVAVAFASPDLLPDASLSSPQLFGTLLGAIVFLGGALTHEAMTRRAEAARVEGRLLSLGNLAARLREEVRQLRDIQRAQAAQRAGQPDIEVVAGEMRMLKSLIEQITVRATEAGASGGPSLRLGPAMGEMEQVPGLGPTVMRSRDLDDDQVMLDVVRDALDADRVDLYTQPIVSLPQRKLQFYECFVRLRAADDSPLPPERYMEIAERAGLAGTIDNLQLMRAVQHVRRMRRRQQPVSYFCNIGHETLNDRVFFSDFIGFMQDNTDLAAHLVFEMAQYDVYRLDPKMDAELAALAKYGFRFSMDEVTNLDLFVSDLSQKGFRYVKVEAETLLAKLSRVGDPRALKRALDRGAIDLIVSGVDSDPMLLDLLDYAIDFGQGALFGEPRPAELR